MPDKCKECGGLGVIFGTPYVPWDEATNAMLKVSACVCCKQITHGYVLRDHIRLCCEAHDGLVAALEEIALGGEGIWTHPRDTVLERVTRKLSDVTRVAKYALAKAQPSQEAGK